MKVAYTKFIFSMLLFGTNGIVASLIALNSYEIVFFRTLIGSIFLVLLLKLSGEKLSLARHKKDLIFIVLSGVSMGTSWMFLYEAYQQIGVSLASLMYYCGPVIVMVLSPVIFRERLTYTKIIGFLIVLVGLLLVNGTPTGETSNTWGITCGLLSALTYFFMVTFNKKAKRIRGIQNSAIQLTAGFVTVGSFMLARQGIYIDLTGVNTAAVLLLGVVNTGVGCYLYFSSLSKIPVQSVAVLGYLELVCAVICSALLLDERMTQFQIVGAVLIISGAIFGELAKARNRH